MLAVRLNETLEQELSSNSKLNVKTKTDVVKEALELFLKDNERKTINLLMNWEKNFLLFMILVLKTFP